MPGFKQTTIGVIPKDWEVAPLAQLIRSVEYGSSAKSSDEGRVPVLRMGNLQGGKIDWTDLVYTDDQTEINKYKLRTGDVLFNRTNTIDLVGKTSIYQGEQPAIFAGYLIRINVIQEVLDSRFLNYVLNTEFSRKFSIKVLSVAVGQANINGQKLKTYPIPLPPTKAEQAAIADALSDADALIESLEQLLAKKRQIKHGAMQELLTGKKRLPGFRETWLVRRLADLILEIGDGATPSTTNAENFGGAVPWVVIEDIRDEITATRSMLTDRGLRSCAAKLWPTGTLIVSTGATIGEVGIARVRVATKQGICGLVVDRTQADTRFLKFWFTANVSKIRSKAQGSTIKEVRAPTLIQFEIDTPSLEEQIAIADALSDMDAGIAAVRAKLNKARQVKQGMMQELLTGQIRLPLDTAA